MEYILDGAKMDSYETVHQYISEVIEIPYGNNLDALSDILTGNSNLSITLINVNALISNLGNYGGAIIRVMTDAQRNNETFHFKIK